jgi:serine/threonine-protein kinase
VSAAFDLSKLGDRYHIDRELGRGGMGAVYLARDVKLDRPVALKVLPPEFATQVALRERFLRETRTAASFSHPNIVPVYSVEETDDVLAYAMAYVEGESLADRVKRGGPLSVREAVRLMQDVGYALAYAHGRGIVHRDIKPDNVMIERATGRAIEKDFGIATLISGPMPSGTEGLTRIGEVDCTPENMSPEQATGDDVDGRSDLYSLGLTAYFGITGTPAIVGDTTGRMLARQITEPLPPVREKRPDIPAALANAIERCAAKDPAERFQNAEALVEAIDAAQLSVPEIPLALRILTQEASSFSAVLFGGLLFISWMVSSGRVGGDAALVIIIIASVLFTRTMQTLREVGRVARAGFGVDEIERGMEAVLAERDQRRTELKADPATQRARRRTLIAAIAMIVLGVVTFRIALSARVEIAPGTYTMTGWRGGVGIIITSIMFGIGWPLLLRSPFQRPIGERLFRLMWLGPIGRAFVQFGGRNVSRPPGAAGAASRPVTSRAAPVVIPPAAAGQLASLESRVAELEKWRRESRV